MMLPPMIPKTQVLSQAVLHNGNCKRFQSGVSVLAGAVAYGSLPHEGGTLAPIDI
jgi:hypothetical protein